MLALKLFKMYKERLVFSRDILQHLYFFVDPVVGPNHPLYLKHWSLNAGICPTLQSIISSEKYIQDLLPQLEQIPSEFRVEDVQESLAKVASWHGVNIGKVYNVVRFLVTGSGVGAPVPHTMSTLGKATCIRRLQQGLVQCVEGSAGV